MTRPSDSRLRGAPVPIGDDPAGTLDDANESHVVFRLQAFLDDEVAVTGREQAIGAAVATEATHDGAWRASEFFDRYKPLG